MGYVWIYQASPIISCDKGSIAAPNKKGDNGTYVQVLPIVAFFAECSTRRPSDKKLTEN